MYRYYQTHHKSPWTVIEDSPDVEEIVRKRGGTKLTILAVSEPVTDDTNRENLAYKGPFYVDVDHRDLGIAIDSTQTLVRNLLGLGITEDNIELYCSGSKGFHIIVPATAFSSGRPRKNLPAVYLAMAHSMNARH